MQKFEQNPAVYLTSAPRRKDYYDWALEVLNENNCHSVVDVGCAAGDFLHFLPESISGLGLDKSEELIEFANSNRGKKNLSFVLKDFLNDYDDLHEISVKFCADALAVFGTLTTIKDIDRLLNLVDIFAPKVLLINDFFNPEPIDVALSYCEAGASEYQEGFNIYSLATIKKKLSEKMFVDISIKCYAPTSPIQKSENILRSYSAKLDDELVMTNATGLVLRGFCIVAVRDKI